MRSPEEIRRTAANKYRDFLREHFAGRSIFPYDIDFGRPRGGRELDRIAEESRSLMNGSATTVGHGYTVETELVGTMFGQQRFPSRVFFPDAGNFLRFIEKESEFAIIVREITLIENLVPSASTWAREHPLDVLAKSGKWADIAAVLNYLLLFPRPECYPRQLPLHVSGKLLGDEQRTICSILSTIPGPHWTQGPDYFAQLGLRQPPASFLRFRFLDQAVRTANGYPVDDLSVSIDTLRIQPLGAEKIFMVENLMTFLAFPPVRGALVLFGEGNAAARVADLTWLRQTNLTYWGDLDPFGFVILNRLRAKFPNVRSILMDGSVLAKYESYATEAKLPTDYNLPHLTDSERDVARELFDRRRSIEQEKIPQLELSAVIEGS